MTIESNLTVNAATMEPGFRDGLRRADLFATNFERISARSGRDAAFAFEREFRRSRSSAAETAGFIGRRIGEVGSVARTAAAGLAGFAITRSAIDSVRTYADEVGSARRQIDELSGAWRDAQRDLGRDLFSASGLISPDLIRRASSGRAAVTDFLGDVFGSFATPGGLNNVRAARRLVRADEAAERERVFAQARRDALDRDEIERLRIAGEDDRADRVSIDLGLRDRLRAIEASGAIDPRTAGELRERAFANRDARLGALDRQRDLDAERAALTETVRSLRQQLEIDRVGGASQFSIDRTSALIGLAQGNLEAVGLDGDARSRRESDARRLFDARISGAQAARDQRLADEAARRALSAQVASRDVRRAEVDGLLAGARTRNERIGAEVARERLNFEDRRRSVIEGVDDPRARRSLLDRLSSLERQAIRRITEPEEASFVSLRAGVAANASLRAQVIGGVETVEDAKESERSRRDEERNRTLIEMNTNLEALLDQGPIA